MEKVRKKSLFIYATKLQYGNFYNISLKKTAPFLMLSTTVFRFLVCIFVCTNPLLAIFEHVHACVYKTSFGLYFSHRSLFLFFCCLFFSTGGIAFPWVALFILKPSGLVIPHDPDKKRVAI